MTKNSSQSLYDFNVKLADSSTVSLKKYLGQVVLVVNVASKCGFTPQYAGLETLFKKYQDKGFTVLAFPCNQFGAQEPGDNQEIMQFCKLSYDVTFPVMSKVEVNGDKADPIFKHLKTTAPGLLGTEAIKWNFTKFLVGKKGQVLERYSPQTKPEDIAKDIEKALAQS